MDIERLDFESVMAMMDRYFPAPDLSDPRARRRQRILEAATELFVEQGYRRTSVDQVAQRAGVAKGTVYLYFKSKAELIIHAIAEEKRAYLGVFRQIMEQPKGRRLQAWLKSSLVLVTEMPLVSRLVSGDRELLGVLYEVGADQGQDWQKLQQGFVAQMLADDFDLHHLPRRELEERAAVLLGLVLLAGSLTDPQISGGLSVNRFAELLSDAVVNGLSHLGKGSKDRKENK